MARVMTTPMDVSLSRLTREGYSRFLDRAQERGFSIVRFSDFLEGPPATEPYIALRHDIDFAPRFSAEMAEMEHAAGIASTYFVLVDGTFYNPLDREVVAHLRRIRDLGHEIGLHFSVGVAADENIGEEVAFRMDVLSRIVDAPIRSFSQHDPVNAGFANVRLPERCEPCVDAYRVTAEHDLLYVSESAMMWRDLTFETALEQGRNLCLLAHPHSWLADHHDYVAMIRSFETEQANGVEERFGSFVDALAQYYRRRREEGA
jgi:hypothetical protein